MSEVIKFHCPHCGQKLSAEASWIGQITQCPRCKSDVEVPYQARGVKVEEMLDRRDRNDDVLCYAKRFNLGLSILSGIIIGVWIFFAIVSVIFSGRNGLSVLLGSIPVILCAGVVLAFMRAVMVVLLGIYQNTKGGK